MSIFTNKIFLVLTQILTAVTSLYGLYWIFNFIDHGFLAFFITTICTLGIAIPLNCFVTIGCQTKHDNIKALEKPTKGLPIYKLAKIFNRPKTHSFLKDKIESFTKNKIVLHLENDSRIIIKNNTPNIDIFIKDNIDNANIVFYRLKENFERTPEVKLNSNYDLVNDIRCQKILSEATHKLKHLIVKHEMPEFNSYQSKDTTISKPHIISILKPLCQNLIQEKNNKVQIKEELQKILDSLDDLNTLLQKDQQKVQINSLMDYFLPRLRIMIENYNRMIQVKRQDLVKDQIKNAEKSIIELQKLLDEYIRKIFLGEYVNEEINVDTMKEIAHRIDQIKIPQFS